MNLARRGRTYEFISRIENLGGDAEGKAVFREVSFLSVWPGKGAENIVVEVVVGGASGSSRASAEHHPASVLGGGT
jgi:hypothetical protein